MLDDLGALAGPAVVSSVIAGPYGRAGLMSDVSRLGDLCLAAVGVGDVDPRGVIDARDRRTTGLVWRTMIEYRTS